ncbi:hypothetical protein M5K25_017647 [Dendrobium thyrsiflorum]|uniref:Uncharacterized protein n=1 Tax=Dendrobium thyrsiflorum TaxID=117978 RepID=A0ABD0UNC1_DENTH
MNQTQREPGSEKGSGMAAPYHPIAARDGPSIGDNQPKRGKPPRAAPAARLSSPGTAARLGVRQASCPPGPLRLEQNCPQFGNDVPTNCAKLLRARIYAAIELKIPRLSVNVEPSGGGPAGRRAFRWWSSRTSGLQIVVRQNVGPSGGGSAEHRAFRPFGNPNRGLNLPTALQVLDLDSFGLGLSRFWCRWVRNSEPLSLTISLLKSEFR